MTSEAPGVRNIYRVLSEVDEHWSPRTVAIVNDYDVRVVKVLGDFTRHSHSETEEFFLVLSGALVIETDTGAIHLEAGDTHVVRRGEYHRPRATTETTLLLFEPSATVNTGDSPSERTADRRLA
jgi:mannose-6-phosphate isomerase-like protein (cupin superfamily)